MPKRSRATLYGVVFAGGCFLAGVVATLLWTSLTSSNSQAQQPAVGFGNTSDAFNTVAEALRTQELPSSHKTDPTSSLSKDDLVIAIPSSLARSAPSLTATPADIYSRDTLLM